MFAPRAQAQTTAPGAINGVYNGTYTCAIGPRTLKLSLAASGEGSLTGVFTFFLPPASHTHAYSYSLSGPFDASSEKFSLRPVKWETPPPPGYSMVGMSGAFDPGARQVAGKITAETCGTFQATRESANIASIIAPQKAAGADEPTARAEQIQFYAYTPPTPIEIFGNAWSIFADGVIDEDAGARLKKLIEDDHIPAKSMLALNSPGGSLIGGMKLGKIIREAGLATYVGVKGDDSHSIVKGVCYSACTLAFIGGEYRYISKDSEYGVHRFYFTDKGDQHADVAQILSAAVVQYIRDMDVDPDLFSEMSMAGKSEIITLPQKELIRLNVINNGVKLTTWTIESIDEGLYLKGQRETYRGINKFILACGPKGAIVLVTIFDPEHREDEIPKMKAISLAINGDLIPIADHLISGPDVVNGWINTSFMLDERLLNGIRGAKTVGIAFQYSYEAPVFLGFDDMNFGDGAKKLPGFLNACH